MEGRETQAKSTPVVHKSSTTVRPFTYQIGQGEAEEERRRIHLNPRDLYFLYVEYIQKGMLLPKPPTPLNLHQLEEPLDHPLISHLIKSLSQTLDHFFPLAGRLSILHHDTTPPSTSVFIDCNNQGAEFIVAAAKDVAVSDVLVTPPLYIPDFVQCFFPLNRAINLDGRTLPLLSIQLTELSDGAIFIGCSINHSVVDGTSFWHLFNSWSEIARTGLHQISSPPVVERWFHGSCSPPIRLPFGDLDELINRFTPPSQVKECIFHFSAKNVRDLKAKANLEMKTTQISSLQALQAHVWRSTVRAQELDLNRETTYHLVCGTRSRIEPPLSPEYLGNYGVGVAANALVRDILTEGLGWAAWQLNQAVASQNYATICSWLENWCKKPSFIQLIDFKQGNQLAASSSQRFNMYGNDFGWGRPMAIRSGSANKIDGKITVYPGLEEGSISLEVCLPEIVLSRLVEDMEFMGAVST